MERNQGPFAPPNPNEPIDIRNPPSSRETIRQRRQAYQAQITPEENALLAECTKEAFYQRSLPLGITAGLLTQYAMYKGLIKRGGFKIFMGYFSGYMIGKASYIPACRRKVIERLPNSNLARRMQGLPIEPVADVQQEDQQTQRQQTHEIETYTNTNLDTNRPTYDLDSRIAPLTKQEDPIKRSMTYDELRQQSRAKSVQPPPPSSNQDDRSFPRRPMQDPMDERLPQQEMPSQRRKPTFFADKPPPQRSGSTNKYGDVWDK